MAIVGYGLFASVTLIIYSVIIFNYLLEILGFFCFFKGCAIKRFFTFRVIFLLDYTAES